MCMFCSFDRAPKPWHAAGQFFYATPSAAGTAGLTGTAGAAGAGAAGAGATGGATDAESQSVVGIVIGALVGFALLVGLIFLVRHACKKQ